MACQASDNLTINTAGTVGNLRILQDTTLRYSVQSIVTYRSGNVVEFAIMYILKRKEASGQETQSRVINLNIANG